MSWAIWQLAFQFYYPLIDNIDISLHYTNCYSRLTASLSNHACAVNGGISIAFSADDVSLAVTGVVTEIIIPLHTEGGTVWSIEVLRACHLKAKLNFTNTFITTEKGRSSNVLAHRYIDIYEEPIHQDIRENVIFISHRDIQLNSSLFKKRDTFICQQLWAAGLLQMQLTGHRGPVKLSGFVISCVGSSTPRRKTSSLPAITPVRYLPRGQLFSLVLTDPDGRRQKTKRLSQPLLQSRSQHIPIVVLPVGLRNLKSWTSSTKSACTDACR